MGDQQPPANKIDPQARWSDIELLPAWDEEYYDVYQAKKFGKWVMLKTLKPQFRDDPQYQAMIEKEFDVRYNLSHPNIVMINDFEDVPGLGRCIITDDVYGDSLRSLLDNNKLSDKHYEQLLSRLTMAMEYIQQNHIAHHPIRPETIIFTEDIGNLKLIDVGFDQKRSLSHEDTSDDIVNFGKIMLEVLKKTGRHDPNVHRIAERASRNGYTDVQALQMALSGRSNQRLYIIIIAILAILSIVLAWMTAHSGAML
jgi:serine/threonine protein kinase